MVHGGEIPVTTDSADVPALLERVDAERDPARAITVAVEAVRLARDLVARENTPQSGRTLARALGREGAVLTELARRDEADARLRESAAVAGQCADTLQQRHAHCRLGASAQGRGDLDGTRLHYEQALSLAPDVRDRTAWTLRINLGTLSLDQGHLDDALHHARSAADVARELASPELEMDAHRVAATALLLGGETSAARAECEPWLVTARSGSDATLAHRMLATLARIETHDGRYEAALEYYVEALPMARRSGIRAAHVALLGNLALLYVRLQRGAEAVASAAEARALAMEVGNASLLGQASRIYSVAHQENGDLRRALEYAQEALRAPSAASSDAERAAALCRVGEAHAALGDATRATPFFVEGAEAANACGIQTYQVAAELGLARCEIAAGDAAAAVARLEALEPITEATSDPELTRSRTEVLVEALEEAGKLERALEEQRSLRATEAKQARRAGSVHVTRTDPIDLGRLALERILNCAPDAMLLLRTDGSIAFANERAQALLAGAQRALAGARVEEFCSEVSLPAARADREALLENPVPGAIGATLELEMVRADGSPFPAGVTMSVVCLDQETYHVWSIRDLTSRRRIEDRLRASIEEVSALKERLQHDNRALRVELDSRHALESIVGSSDALLATVARVMRVAPTDATVLVLGETGTGKDLMAREIHRHSRRRERPLVTVNCAALPESLIESELFGHEKGAFTGALARKIGRFELADGGTIFLDEVGDLPLLLQAKLLRVLQSGEFERLGASETRKADVRVVAATNRDLTTMMKDGSFRQDLYFRLSVFPIRVPPLRERRDDIPLLTWFFVDRIGRRLGRKIEEIDEHDMRRLIANDWIGNVRELENVIERALILSSGPRLALDEAALPLADSTAPESSSSAMQDVERAHIEAVLVQNGWRVKGVGNAAERLGLKPSTLRYRMKKLGIKRPG